MKYIDSLIYETNNILDNRNGSARNIARNNLSIAMNIPNFESNYKKYKSLTPLIGRYNAEGKNSEDLINERNEIKIKLVDILKLNGLTFEDITPQYQCKLCDDTGLLNGEKCSCYNEIYNQLKQRKLQALTADTPLLRDVKSDVFNEQKPQYERICNALIRLVDNFPNTSKKIIVFAGGAGTGKTYLAKATVKEFEIQNYETLSMSAFALNNMFLKYHTSFDGSASNNLDTLINADILLIDDLGTEPKLNNVTCEYLLSIINERNVHGKLTIMTTNLSNEYLNERYGERIASRIFDSNISTIVQFPFDDIRIKK